jgi:hypothetical protein
VLESEIAQSLADGMHLYKVPESHKEVLHGAEAACIHIAAYGAGIGGELRYIEMIIGGRLLALCEECAAQLPEE